uniref:Eukaryotic translation initiation factor 3 subunit E N-terminal domain-containing protein n=1 Tax=Manihot esculenta TaxID=3983 RepID=A0A199UAI7_MANES
MRGPLQVPPQQKCNWVHQKEEEEERERKNPNEEAAGRRIEKESDGFYIGSNQLHDYLKNPNSISLLSPPSIRRKYEHQHHPRAIMATYDLTPRIAPNLDRHLVLPLLEFLQERQLYLEEQIFKSKIELLSKTNMVDYAMDIHKSLYHTEDVPQDMIERRAEVVARLKVLEEGAAPLVAFLQNANAMQEFDIASMHSKVIIRYKSSNDCALVLLLISLLHNFITEVLGRYLQVILFFLNPPSYCSFFLGGVCWLRDLIGPKQIEALYQYAKFQFECGNYSGVADYLYQYRALCTNSERSLSALWGKLVAEILMQNWDIALEELNRLKEIIDSKSFSSPLNQIQSRIWLMHWSLFIFFNHDNGRTQIIDLFNQDKHDLSFSFLYVLAFVEFL